MKRKGCLSFLTVLVLLVLAAGIYVLAVGPGKLSIPLKIVYQKPHEELVKAEAARYSLDENLIYAIMKAESGFDENALSPAGAKGLMQITDDTFEWVNSKHEPLSASPDVFAPADNIHTGAGLLRILKDEFDDDNAVLAAYNAGIGNVAEWLKEPEISADGIHLDIEAISFPETRHYVKRVLDNYKTYAKLYSETED